MANGFTPKQQAFIAAYLGPAKGNGAEAARMAGYSDPDVSAFDCKRNPAIRAHIDAVLAERAMSGMEVLAELAEVARSEWRDHVKVVTNPKTGETIEARIVLGDKVKALELLGKYHRLFTERVEQTGANGGPQEVTIVFDRRDDADSLVEVS